MGKPDQPRGPDGRWRPRNSLLGGIAAIAIGVAAISGPAATSSLSGSSGTNGRSGSSKQVKARNRDVARLARRLQNQNLHVDQVMSSLDDDCAANSYGRVHVWFNDHSCTALYRILLRVTDRNRSVAMVAVAAVDMPQPSEASELRKLTDEYGTGNIRELRERGPSARWTGRYYVSDQDGETFVNAQAEPVGQAATAQRLAEFAANTVVRD